MEFLVVFITLVFVVVVFIVVGQIGPKGPPRSELWIKKADDMDMQFEILDPTVPHSLSHFKLFSVGGNMRSENVLRGVYNDDQVMLTDFRYTTGSGKNRSTHYQTVCVIQSDALWLPHFFIHRQSQGFFGDLLKGQDIDFSEDPGFSSAFILQGSNERAVRELFSAEIRAVFCRIPQDLKCECHEDTMVYHLGVLIDPGAGSALIAQAASIVEIFKRRAENR